MKNQNPISINVLLLKPVFVFVFFLLFRFSGISQSVGISSDASTPEVMLDIKAPSGYAKATTAAVQTFFQIHSYDAVTDALKLRLGFKTDATQANRYGFIDFPDFTGGTPTYLNLALQPSGGNVGIGTTSPGATLQVNGTMKVFGAYSSKSVNTIYQALTDGFVIINKLLSYNDFNINSLSYSSTIPSTKIVDTNKHFMC